MTSARAFRLPNTTCDSLRLMAAESGKTQTKIVISAIRLYQRRERARKKAQEVKQKGLDGADALAIRPKLRVKQKKSLVVWRFLLGKLLKKKKGGF